MLAHPINRLRRDIVCGKLHDAVIYRTCIDYKFDALLPALRAYKMSLADGMTVRI